MDSPSRAAFMTGKYALNLGNEFVFFSNMKHCTKRIASALDGLFFITVQILSTPLSILPDWYWYDR